MIASVTSVTSIAIKNARMYEKACIEARTDEMTGLLNRKYFYEVLNEEFEKIKILPWHLPSLMWMTLSYIISCTESRKEMFACSILPRSFAAVWVTVDI